MNDTFKMKNGNQIELTVDDITNAVVAKNCDGQLIGGIEFSYIEDPNGSYLKIVNLFLNKAGPEYLRQGIGRACIKLVIEVTGFPICAVFDNGQRLDDGSHLTGDAPGFVSKLIEEGLITRC
ncbi:MAG: GNAT family N-acetyltransferase [Hyphomicrobiales bacterium]